VENASYGLTICAERAAVAAAVGAGVRQFSRIAIVASGESRPYPCGACRQVLAEFCDGGLEVLVAPLARLQENETLRLDELLPHTFTLGEQDRQEAASAGDTGT
jgi:cytidine deaminase